jgi:hypothetical protein
MYRLIKKSNIKLYVVIVKKVNAWNYIVVVLGMVLCVMNYVDVINVIIWMEIKN